MIGIGATSVDYVYRLPVRPEAEGPHSKIRISSHTVSCGGQMATALAACATLGLRSKFAGVIGSDDNGTRVQEALVARGVDVADAVVHHGPNQFAVILVDERTGERMVLWSRDDTIALQADELPPALLPSARVVHVDDVDQQAAIQVATLARAAGAIVTSDIDRVTDRTDELVAAVSIPILAEHVPTALTGETESGARCGCCTSAMARMMCVTLGRSGAMIVDGGRLALRAGFRRRRRRHDRRRRRLSRRIHLRSSAGRGAAEAAPLRERRSRRSAAPAAAR